MKGHSESDDEDDAPIRRQKVDLANSSIQAGSKVINTIAGPIREWLPIPENLPKHPTMFEFIRYTTVLHADRLTGGRRQRWRSHVHKIRLVPFLADTLRS